jgi:hypothetical protein
MELPDNVRRFLLRHIDSIAELEGLLLMRRERLVPWTSGALAGRLYVSEDAAALVLDVLHRRELLAQEPAGYRYEPANEELGTGVEAVAELYSRSVIPITNLIHGKARPSIQQFADAFRLRDTKP